MIGLPNAVKWEEVAERWRTKWCNDYVGHDVPYAEVVPIYINFNGKPEGATSFRLDKGRVSDFRMNVTGNSNQLVNSVIPHEVMHTVLINYHKDILPRWADEGLCCCVEPVPTKYSRKGNFRFREIMNMKDYPSDTIGFYQQSESMVRFLIKRKGLHTFRDFLTDYLTSEGDWPQYLEEYYGFKTYDEAEAAWLTPVTIIREP